MTEKEDNIFMLARHEKNFFDLKINVKSTADADHGC
jgi:hypothetical protein